MTVAERFHAIRERIDRSATAVRRDPSEITLVAVSKTFTAEIVAEALAAGVTDLGENRVQEAKEKRQSVAAPARWHLIGHLQSNKAKEAARLFDMIESVDSVDLARRLAREAERLDKQLEILLQVNVGSEEQKSGVAANDARGIAKELISIPGLKLRGLMTIPPVGSPEASRAHFRNMRVLFDELREDLASDSFNELSMGMSEDFEIAIEEGATIVRIGRAIFGGRG